MLFLPENVSRCLKVPYSGANCPLRLLARTLLWPGPFPPSGRAPPPFASGMAGLRLAPQFLPGTPASHTGRPFRHDVRSGTRGLVADLDQDPAPLAGPGQREAAGQFAAVQDEGDMPGLVPGHLGGPLVPDDHRATSARLALMHALELTRRQGMVFHRHGQPPHTRIERRSLGHRPRAQYPACLQAEVEVQRRRVMQLDDEAGRRGHRLSMSLAIALRSARPGIVRKWHSGPAVKPARPSWLLLCRHRPPVRSAVRRDSLAIASRNADLLTRRYPRTW